jgi:actin-related protein
VPQRNRQYAAWMGGSMLAADAAEGVEVSWLEMADVEEEGYDRLLGGSAQSESDDD